MNFRINIGCSVEIACIPYSLVSNPKAIDKLFPGRKALDAVASHLANNRVTRFDDPSLVISWPSHVSYRRTIQFPRHDRLQHRDARIHRTARPRSRATGRRGAKHIIASPPILCLKFFCLSSTSPRQKRGETLRCSARLVAERKGSNVALPAAKRIYRFPLLATRAVSVGTEPILLNR